MRLKPSIITQQLWSWGFLPCNEADYNIKHNLEPEYDFHAVNQVNSIMNILYVMNGWLQRVLNINFEQQASILVLVNILV